MSTTLFADTHGRSSLGLILPGRLPPRIGPCSLRIRRLERNDRASTLTIGQEAERGRTGRGGMNASSSNASRVAKNIKGVGDEGSRRAEVLEIAAELIATSGLRTSMHDIARASDLKAGSLYHHFESKEALLVELLRRYHAELDGIAAKAMLSSRSPRPERIWTG